MNPSHVQYQVDANDRIRFVDDEWVAFAQQNAAAELSTDAVLGQSLWEFVVGIETRHLYEILFAAVRDKQTAKTVPFRCDSPTRRRHMELLVAPLAAGWLAIRGTLIREEARPYVPLLDFAIRRSDELLSICGWCKNILLPEQLWVEVEVAIARLGLFERSDLPGLTHSICAECESRVELGD